MKEKNLELKKDIEHLFTRLFFHDFYEKKMELLKKWDNLIFKFNNHSLPPNFHPKLFWESYELLKERLEYEKNTAVKVQEIDHFPIIRNLIKDMEKISYVDLFKLGLDIEDGRNTIITNFNTNSLFFKYEMIGIH